MWSRCYPVLGPVIVPVLGTIALLLTSSKAEAIVIRHDVDDSEYVVDDADYPALTDLISPGDCIGTLVEASHVLTVAHCAVDLGAGDSLAFAGVDYEVADVFLHPQWDDEDAFDIAVVRLSSEVADVEPIPIYRGSDENGATLTLVGRGVTATGLVGEAGGRTDGLLRRATNVVISVDPHFLEVVFEHPDDAGVLPLEGVGAAGDSGCPAFLDVDGVRYVAGLNSWGDGDAGVGVAEYAAFDYQTRVSRYLEWIDDQVVPVDADSSSSSSSSGDGSSTTTVGQDDSTSSGSNTTSGSAESGGQPGGSTSSGDTDTSPSADEDGGGGCGSCQTDPQRTGWLWLFVALLGARRRSSHRKR